MDLVTEIVKEAAKYGMVPRIAARHDDECTIVVLCKPPETQCCVSCSLSGLEVLQNSSDENIRDMIDNRVKNAAQSIESLLSAGSPIEWRPVFSDSDRLQKWIKGGHEKWYGTNWFKDTPDGEPYPEIPEFVKEGMKALEKGY